MPTDHQELQGWTSDHNCDLRNALEFSDSAVGSLLCQGTVQLAAGLWDVPMDGSTRSASMAPLVEESFAKFRVVEGHRVGVAIHGGEPSVRSCSGFRGERVGEASNPNPPKYLARRFWIPMTMF